MPQAQTAEQALKSVRGKVLLINPPVVDSRYPWIRWNQPLDLLKLGSLLRDSHECDVRLFDFTLPDKRGAVPKSRFSFDPLVSDLGNSRFIFGQPWATFDRYLDTLAAEHWQPRTILLTSLTSFWWQTVPLVASRIRNRLKSAKIIAYGNYPALETSHAVAECFSVDIVASDYLDLRSWPADWSLYGHDMPGFCALDLRSPSVLDEIAAGVSRGITHFVFFNEDIFLEFDSLLGTILHEVLKKGWRLQFHGVCGVVPKSFPHDHAKLINDAQFTELHLEPALKDDGQIDEDTYRAVMKELGKAGFVVNRGGGWQSDGSRTMSGFMWIGRPNERVEDLVWNALKLLQLTGMVIPKPYSPTPGTAEYVQLKESRKELEPDETSPHRLPFAEMNGISRIEYEDLYRLTGLLNYRVRGGTFDFLGRSYLAQVVRESLEAGRWVR